MIKITKNMLRSLINEAWSDSNEGSTYIQKTSAKMINTLESQKEELQNLFESETDWRPLEKHFDIIISKLIKLHKKHESDPMKRFLTLRNR